MSGKVQLNQGSDSVVIITVPAPPSKSARKGPGARRQNFQEETGINAHWVEHPFTFAIYATDACHLQEVHFRQHQGWYGRCGGGVDGIYPGLG
eukprot:scaffold179865_cov18-Tisochrysis_lutea.AAC.1